MKIGTHSGLHHPDDVFACSILNKIFNTVEVVRSRNPNELDMCSILVDVGNRYSPPKYFDHHQRSGPRRKDGIPFSSCGLIWKHYGKNFISKSLSEEQLSPDDIDIIFNELDKNIILYIDKVDNHLIKPDKLSVCEYIMMLNDNGSLDAFYEAMKFSGKYLEILVKEEYKNLNSKKYLLNMEKKENNNGRGYIVLEYEVDSSCLKEKDGIDFVVYPSQDKETIILKCLPYDHDEVTPRFIFEEKWRGLRGKQILRAGSQVNDAVFVHQQGFCGGAKTIKGAIGMINMTHRNFK